MRGIATGLAAVTLAAISVDAAPAAPSRPGAGASKVSLAAGTLDFDYSYPAAVKRYPALARWLDAGRAKLRAQAEREAAEDKRDAGTDRPFNKHAASVEWKVVTETPRFLSLSALRYRFTGGAHGLGGTDSLVWDKQAGKQLEPAELFRPAALQAAAGPAWCRALDAERAKRRGAPVVRNPDDAFTTCPKLSDLTVLLGSTDRRRIDRIGLVAGPYLAGPYAEGEYEITLPVTPAVLKAVKPAYADAFAAR